MKILALDTTSEFGSVALVEDGRVVEEKPLRSPEGFAHILFQQIEGLLARHDLTLHAVDAFAAASGPGAFTGIRVGLAAIKGLAEATGKPAFGVSTLQAMAWFGSRPLRATVADARRGEVFGAVYDSALNLVQPETVGGLDAWLNGLPAGEIEILADGSPAHENLAARVVPVAVPVVKVPRVLAGAVGAIAAARLACGLAGDPAAVDANYVRRSDAELAWRDTD